MQKRLEPILVMTHEVGAESVTFYSLPVGDWLLPTEPKCGVAFQNQTTNEVRYKLLSPAPGTLPQYRSLPPSRYVIDKAPAPQHLYDGWMRVVVLTEGLEYCVFVVKK